MKIADVTVGTEYAFDHYPRSDDYSRCERASRVVVRARLSGGKVRVSSWNREAKAFDDFVYETSAQKLVMPWVDAVPIRNEIRKSRAAAAKAGQERVAREQVALRAVGQFLEDHDAAGMNGLPYNLKRSIALANGDEGLKDMGHDLGMRPTHRHDPKVEVNVITLLALLRMAYEQGYIDADNGNNEAAWSKPSAD